MNDEDKMPFGMHKGKMMSDVPAKYLIWLRDEGCSHSDVSKYIKENWTSLLKECPDYIDEN